MKEQVKEISSFYSKFAVSNIDDQTQLVRSSTQAYLVKLIRLEEDTANLDNVVETLEQHLTLSDQFLLTLVHYDIQHTHSHICIRSIYQYSQPTLKEEIEQRRQKLIYFQADELWMIVYTVIRALEYLQRFNIGYGVLGCDKIFLGEKVKLLDPSAIAEDPLIVTNNRLHSPQILLEYDNIDILKSDVFIFGLCMLQAALLIDCSPEFGCRIDETRIKLYLSNVDKLYEPEFSNMLRQMLEFDPHDRPTFSQIREYLQQTLDLSSTPEQGYYAPLSPDLEDEATPLLPCEETGEYENIDLEDEQVSESQSGSLNQYERAKRRFLNDSHYSDNCPSLSRISEQSQASSRILNNKSTVKIQKKMVSKSIKEKLVKMMSSQDLQMVQVIEHKGDGVFTDPKLMADIQNELHLIGRKRSSHMRSKQNICRNY